MTDTGSRALPDHPIRGDAAGGGEVLAFVAPWCGPCRRLAPVLGTVAARHHPTVRLVTVPVDRDPALAAEHGVSATPTIVVLRDGREVARAVGGVGEDELDRLFDAASSGAATSAGARRAGTRTDVTLRLGAGASLLAAGLLAGGQPVLLLAGTCALAWAAAPCRAWRRAGAAPSAPESTR